MSGTTALKTPTEDIQRKDLTVAMELLNTNDRDYLLHALALVQELKEGQAIYRASQLKDADVLGDTVQVVGTKISGVVTDIRRDDYGRGDWQLVVDGKLFDVPTSTTYVIVTPAPPVGNDTLQLVED